MIFRDPEDPEGKWRNGLEGELQVRYQEFDDALSALLGTARKAGLPIPRIAEALLDAVFECTQAQDEADAIWVIQILKRTLSAAHVARGWHIERESLWWWRAKNPLGLRTVRRPPDR